MDEEEISVDELINEDQVIIRKVISTHYIINLDNTILDPSEYRSVFSILRDATEFDKITFIIDTDGGYATTMIQFFNYLLHTKAETTAEIYQACSAGAFIMCCVDTIILKDFCSIMFHQAYQDMTGSLAEIQDRVNFLDKQNKDITNTVYSGFLTKDEITKIHNGQEVWIDQKSGISRLKHFKSIKQRLLK